MKSKWFNILLMLEIIFLSISCASEETRYPVWLENDAELAIQQRTVSDFSLSMSQAQENLVELYPNITQSDINRYIEQKYLEVKVIDGEKRMHRKSPGNLKLLCPEIRGDWNGRGSDATTKEILWVDSIIKSSKGDGSVSNEKVVKYRFVIDVPKHDFLIGDTLRVSLTADPVEEVKVGWQILKGLGIRNKGVEFVSCPTCGRTQIDLIGLANKVETMVAEFPLDIKVAVMGCVVNGPGEAKEADLGVAGGIGEGLIIKKGEIYKKVPEDQLLDALRYELENWSK